MSTQTVARPRLSIGTLRRPHLRLVSRPAQRTRRAPFIVLVVLVLAGALLGLLALNTLAAQDAFRLHDLQQRSAHLADEEQALRLDLAHRNSPEELARRAQQLGMVPSDSPAFLRLADGALVGVSTPATAPPAPPAPVTPDTGAATGHNAASAAP